MFAPALLRNTDEFFFTASNQIVKDLRSPTDAYFIRRPAAGLETCSSRTPHLRTRATGKLLELEKEPNRKAVFRPARWPARSFVTVPYRGSLLLIPLSPQYPQTARTFRSRDPLIFLATCSEYQERDAHASPGNEIFSDPRIPKSLIPLSSLK